MLGAAEEDVQAAPKPHGTKAWHERERGGSEHPSRKEVTR